MFFDVTQQFDRFDKSLDFDHFYSLPLALF